MADHFIEHDGIGALGQCAVEAPRPDLLKLLVITDQDELRLRRVGGADQLDHVATPDHPRLIDQEHRVLICSMSTPTG